MSTWVGRCSSSSLSFCSLAWQAHRGPEDASRTQSGPPAAAAAFPKNPQDTVRGPPPRPAVSSQKLSLPCLPVAHLYHSGGYLLRKGGSLVGPWSQRAVPPPEHTLTPAVAMLLHIPHSALVVAQRAASPPPLPAAAPVREGALHSAGKARWWGDHDGGPGPASLGEPTRSPTRAAALLQGASRQGSVLSSYRDPSTPHGPPSVCPSGQDRGGRSLTRDGEVFKYKADL